MKDDDGLPFRNRRTVAWKGRFTREDKSALRLLCDRNESVWPVNHQEKLEFFEVLLGDDALEPSERVRIQDIVREMREQMPPSPVSLWDPWEGAFLEPNERERMLRLLQRKQILQGPRASVGVCVAGRKSGRADPERAIPPVLRLRRLRGRVPATGAEWATDLRSFLRGDFTMKKFLQVLGTVYVFATFVIVATINVVNFH